MKTLEILAISGYSRTGKSTVAKELIDRDWVDASTTDYLTLATINYYGLSVSAKDDFLTKEKDEYYLARFGKTTRDMKIHVAEDVIVPQYGRYLGLVVPTIKKAKSALKTKDYPSSMISTVNISEYELFKQAIDAYLKPWYEIKEYPPIYIDRATGLTDIDLRVPFGERIDNNGTIQETMQQIFKHITANA